MVHSGNNTLRDESYTKGEPVCENVRCLPVLSGFKLCILL